MPHVLFVRHGQDEDNANNILNGHRQQPLTAQGRLQASRAARRISLLRPDVIYTSPLRRTRETAEILAELLGVRRLIEMAELVERDFGVLTGKTYDDIPNFATEWIQLPGYRYFVSGEGIEPFADVRRRVQTVNDMILREHPHERVVVVSHGDVFKMFLAERHNLTIDQALRTPFIENAEVADLGLI